MKLPPLRRVKQFLEESNAIEEVYGEKALNQALNAWNYIIRQDQLNLSNICKTHEILMEGLIKEHYRGRFRDCQVVIAGKMGLDYNLVPSAIGEWAEQMNYAWGACRNDQCPLLEQLHISYEKIHPFVDGNGRTGRIFWNWGRVKNELSLKIILEIEKYDYYQIFN
jgi:Fic family protein